MPVGSVLSSSTQTRHWPVAAVSGVVSGVQARGPDAGKLLLLGIASEYPAAGSIALTTPETVTPFRSAGCVAGGGGGIAGYGANVNFNVAVVSCGALNKKLAAAGFVIRAT